MTNPPPTMLPGTVHTRFLARSAQDDVPWRAPRAKTVMLATECSKPEATKASNAHQSTTNLAASLRVRAAIHRARQTSMLHSTDRQNSCGPVRRFFDLMTLVISFAAGPVARVPPPYTRAANPIDPARLPTSEAIHTATSSLKLTLRVSNPCSITMALPVNSSAPANTTRVRATPKTSPCTSLAMGLPAVTSGAATLSNRTTATPTKAPARADDHMYRGRSRTSAAFAWAWPDISSTAVATGMGIFVLILSWGLTD